MPKPVIGLNIRKAYPVVPPKVEYTLSSYGKTIIPNGVKRMHNKFGTVIET